MNISSSLLERSQSQCELCGSDSGLSEFVVPPKTGQTDDEIAVICDTCKNSVENNDFSDENHWRCLNDSMWSVVAGVKVVVYRILQRIEYSWAKDLLPMMYLEDELIEWAKDVDKVLVHKDSNGHQLQDGDNVTLIQDLDVKGANFKAKRGTAVRNIRLVPDNEEHIEGKVNDQQIVILTKYVKKS